MPRAARPTTRRLGAGWDEKKSICNKFLQSSAVACLAWPAERHGDVCFGLADGKVKLGVLKTNKTYTLYAHPSGSPVAALAASPDGRALVSGHADGSLYQFTFPEQQVRGGAARGAGQKAAMPPWRRPCWRMSLTPEVGKQNRRLLLPVTRCRQWRQRQQQI
jgi:intraflagellar transport protein 172